MTGFDTIVIVDWSARSAPSPARPSADAIWVAIADENGVRTSYHRTRSAAMNVLRALFSAHVRAGTRLLAGFDFPFGYPAGFARAACGVADALSLWQTLEDQIEDHDANANNRFAVAASLNAAFPGIGPFWGCPATLSLAGLPARGTERRGHGMPERRAVETAVPRAQPVWKLYTAGSVGSQSLVGIPRLQRIRAEFGDAVSVWPFERHDAPIVLAEVYPSLLDQIGDGGLFAGDKIRDRAQVRLLARALFALNAAGTLPELMSAARGPDLAEEGWILGAGAEHRLRAAIRPDIAPPTLDNDCFALPRGAYWTPVDEALARLRRSLHCVVGRQQMPVAEAAGRVLASDQAARRANPPGANSAVDGYGFAHAAIAPGPNVLPLVSGAALAGGPHDAPVPAGHAVRILTGALLPQGVDTVVLQEDVTAAQGHIAFDGSIPRGANARQAGEDVMRGAPVLRAGQTLRAPDLALLTAVGLDRVEVFAPLRVGVLSTGDELAAPAQTDDPARTYDANRPMLLALARNWGYQTVDLGHVRDDRTAVRATLDTATDRVDAIVTSGGASAGDEDHLSAVLRESGSIQTWRVALKPGRPLALGVWNGKPVFGLPGNPVAAFVCTLIFARPALSALAGGHWLKPVGFQVPAAFEKRKKAGRCEYLRARLDVDGRAEVFASEGSGRISGLSWAEGLVELDDGARDIAAGDLVRYYPFGSFGL